MAASGINEHNEARRKERVILKQSNWRKQMESMPDAQLAVQRTHTMNNNNNPGAGGNSYDREVSSRAQFRVVGSPPCADHHDARNVDKYSDYGNKLDRNTYYYPKNEEIAKADADQCYLPPPIRLNYPCQPFELDANTFTQGRPPLPGITRDSPVIALGGPPNQKRDLFANQMLLLRVPSFPELPNRNRCISTDVKQRRMDHYNRQQAEYSAKISGRYRNFDYMSQW